MKINIQIILLMALTGFVTVIHSADTPFEFEQPGQEKLYKELIGEIRCLVCQNQSLADSNADLAQDLRNEVYRMVTEESEKPDIINFLVARYGDFVLYNPPLKNTTILLWFGPFLFLLIAAVTTFFVVRNRSTSDVDELGAEQQEKLRSLLESDAPEKDK